MRRTLALLALLATSWPHVAVLECALGSTGASAAAPGHHGAAAHAEPGSTAHHGAAHHGAGHEGRLDDHASSGGSAPAGGLQCAMVMACGLVMIQSGSGTAVAETRSGPEEAFEPSVDPPAAAVLSADPPPPRRYA